MAEGNSSQKKKGSLPVSLIASALLFVWIFLAIDSHALYRDVDTSVFSVSIIIGTFTLTRLFVDLGLGLCAQKIKRLAGHVFIVFSCPFLLILGTIFVACAAHGWVGGLPLLVVGAVLCGLGAEAMLVLWLELFVGLDLALVKRIILWAIGIQALSSLLYFVPFEYVFIICLVLPLVGIAGYWWGRRYSHDKPDDRLTHWHRVSFKKAIPLGIGIALLYFGFHFLQAGFQEPFADTAGSLTVETQASILGRWCAFVAVFFAMKRMRDFHYESMFKIAGIMGICAFLILPLPFGSSFMIFCTLAIVACFLTEYAVTLAVVSIASYSSVVPMKLIAWGRAAINVGGVLGVGVGLLLSGVWTGADSAAYLAFISAAAVLLLVIASMWLLREQSISDFLWGRGASDNAALSAADEGGLAVNCSYLATQYALTGREAEVLNLLLMGRSTPYIAETLYISADTVKSHIRHIYQKLGIHNRQDLLTLAREKGIGKRDPRAAM